MNQKIGNIFKGDKVIWMVFFFLCMISIIEVFSASSGLTYKSNDYITPIAKHGTMMAIGAVVAVVVTNIPCRFFKLFTPALLLFSIATLVCVLFLGESVNGANRTLFGFQPSEIAKGTMILAEAQILSTLQTDSGTDRMAFKYIMILCGIFCFLIGIENLSTAILLFGVVYLMMFIGRVPLRQIGWLTAFGVGVVFLFVSSILLLGGDVEKEKNSELFKKDQIEAKKTEKSAVDKVFHRFSTWKKRIYKYANNEEIPPSKFDLDADAQVGHANIAIVSSNIRGVGPGNSVERDFLSQAFSDFIYAIIIEEMGIGGAIFVAFLYVILLFHTASIANRCENSFPALLAMGLALLLVTQAVFNMLVAVGLAPVTGQPLPLISKGGTSTIINCVYIGAILSISRTAKKRTSPKGAKVETMAAD
ncbi:MAG: FtsW/RodA/SpoVE family cell cycle protein [Prevotella sp.]|nr:FtsW/RodA/SpoVE family cell cycle protein [Prevotella sp.]